MRERSWSGRGRVLVKSLGGPMWRRLGGWTVLVLLIVVVLSALQCGEESGPWDPIRIEGAATISGVVSGPAGPVARVTVTARGVGRSAAVGETRARTDSTGRFVLPVAAGEYLVEWDNYYYSARGAGYGVGNNVTGADTIRGAPDESFTGADLTLGGVRLMLRCPASYQGRGMRAEARAVASGQSGIWWSYVRTIIGDSVQLQVDRVPPGAAPLKVWIRIPPVLSEWVPCPPAEAGSPDTFRCQPGEWVDRLGALPDLAEARMRVRGSWEELAAAGFDLEPTLAAFGTDSVRARSQVHGGTSTEEMRLPILAGDTVRLAVEIGFVRRWIGGSSHHTATRFVLRPDEILELPELVESGLLVRLEVGDEGSEIRGTGVLETAAGRIVSEAWIWGSDVAWANLDPGEYYLRYDPGTSACNSYWLERWYPGVRERAAAVPISISGEGAVTRIEWPMTPAGCLEGTIAELPGAPGGRRGTLQVHDGRDSTRAVCSSLEDYGERVDFVLRGLEDGAYALSIQINYTTGPRLWWYPGTWRASEAELLEIRDHARVRGLRWEWPQ